MFKNSRDPLLRFHPAESPPESTDGYAHANIGSLPPNPETHDNYYPLKVHSCEWDKRPLSTSATTLFRECCHNERKVRPPQKTRGLREPFGAALSAARKLRHKKTCRSRVGREINACVRRLMAAGSALFMSSRHSFCFGAALMSGPADRAESRVA